MKCYYPVSVNGETFACGKCFPCKVGRISDWSTRLHFEELNSLSSNFVTLTYSNENLKFPGKKAHARNFATLHTRDVQLFFKRLRKADSKTRSAEMRRAYPIKYICAGEYGTRYKRPHYHLLVFNATQTGIISAWSVNDRPLGELYFGEVNQSTVGYTVGYIAQAAEGCRDPRLSHYGLQLPFLTFSQKLGAAYITPAAVGYHTSPENILHNCFAYVDGQKRHLPRYYRTRIYSATAWAAIKANLEDQERIDALALHQVQTTAAAVIRRHNKRMLESYRKEKSF